MYDLLNTQGCLSIQKEHLWLPERRILHPEAWLFRVFFVKKYRALLARTDALGSWADSELAEDLQSIAEDSQHLTALWTVTQILSDASLFLGTFRKPGFSFSMLSRGSFNTLPWQCYCLLFAVKEKQSLMRRHLWAPLCSGLPLCCHQIGGV